MTQRLVERQLRNGIGAGPGTGREHIFTATIAEISQSVGRRPASVDERRQGKAGPEGSAPQLGKKRMKPPLQSHKEIREKWAARRSLEETTSSLDGVEVELLRELLHDRDWAL